VTSRRRPPGFNDVLTNGLLGGRLLSRRPPRLRLRYFLAPRRQFIDDTADHIGPTRLDLVVVPPRNLLYVSIRAVRRQAEPHGILQVHNALVVVDHVGVIAFHDGREEVAHGFLAPGGEVPHLVVAVVGDGGALDNFRKVPALNNLSECERVDVAREHPVGQVVIVFAADALHQREFLVKDVRAAGIEGQKGSVMVLISVW